MPSSQSAAHWLQAIPLKAVPRSRKNPLINQKYFRSSSSQFVIYFHIFNYRLWSRSEASTRFDLLTEFDGRVFLHVYRNRLALRVDLLPLALIYCLSRLSPLVLTQWGP